MRIFMPASAGFSSPFLQDAHYEKMSTSRPQGITEVAPEEVSLQYAKQKGAFGLFPSRELR